MSKLYDTRIILWISKEQKDQLERYCDENRMKMAEAVRQAIKEYLERRKS